MILENTGSLDMLAGFLRAGIVNNQVDDPPKFEIDFAASSANPITRFTNPKTTAATK